MSHLVFERANIYDSERGEFHTGSLSAEKGVISSVVLSGEADETLPYIIPGLVDVHTHGRNGYDFISASPDKLEFMREEYAKIGTTTVIPSLATSTYEGWVNAADRIRAAGFDGIHFEGRYLNPIRRGAHNPDLLSPLDSREINTLLERMRGVKPFAIHVTMAPELEGGCDFIETAIKGGATVGIGHSDATYEQAMQALEWGATAFTHTFNAMSPIHHRKPGTVTASLLSDAYSEFICDGVHIAPEVIQLAWRAKRHDRFVLVTDSMMATGFGDGDFSIGGLSARVRGGVALTDDGTIAGSTLDLFCGMTNLMKFTGATLEEAAACATINPAREVGIDNMVGSIKVGRSADICIIAPDRQTLIKVFAAGICYK